MGLRAIRVLFKVIITFLMLTIGAAVFAGSIWDGSVSTSRYGYLPQTGLYAASNAFPQNSRVTVTNPNTGKKVDVTVLERLEDNNLFLVLSAEAAESIGLGYGDIFHGSITEQDNNISSNEEELPYNPDPDVNPSANSENFTELALIQNYIEELGGNDDVLTISDIADPIEQIPDTTINEDVEMIIPEESVVEEVAEDIVDTTESFAVSEPDIPAIEEEDIPEVVEIIPEIEEDIPLVDNMPMEEVYISEPQNVLSLPEVVIIPEQVEEKVVIEEDIPVFVGMSTDVPLTVAPIEVRDVLPKIPVPESDIPVITLLDSGVIEETGNSTTVISIPELPIIGVEQVAIPEDETPLAVAMPIDIVPIETEEDIDYLLPELVEVIDNDLPEHTIFAKEEPEAPLEIVLSELDPVIVPPEEKIVISDTLETPDNIEVEVEVVLEPSNLRPPVLPDESETLETEEISHVIEVAELPEPDDTASIELTETEESTEILSGNYNVTKVLVEDSYYLQLGVYREQYSAFNLAGSLGGTYPVTVLVSESSNNRNYKVMVGPLGQDESGVILYNFKSTGYPDAFLRKGL